MGTTPRGYTYPDSTSHTRLWEHFETLATDLDNDVEALANPPICKLVQQTAQTGFANATNAPLLFGAGSEEIDTDGWHSTAANTGRITPDVAGYIEFTGVAHFEAATYTQLVIELRKNGTAIDPQVVARPDPTSVLSSVVLPGLAVACNGSGDYFELWVQQQSGGTRSTSGTAPRRCVFQGKYLRPL